MNHYYVTGRSRHGDTLTDALRVADERIESVCRGKVYDREDIRWADGEYSWFVFHVLVQE